MYDGLDPDDHLGAIVNCLIQIMFSLDKIGKQLELLEVITYVGDRRKYQ